RSRLGGRRDQGIERNETLFRLLPEDMLTVESSHLRVLRILLDFGVARFQLFLAGVLGDAQLIEGIICRSIYVVLVEQERVLSLTHSDFLAAGEDFMAA